MGVAKFSEALVNAVTDSKSMYGTGKFAQTVVKCWDHAGVARVVTPLAGALVDAGQISGAVQKTYKLAARVCSDITTAKDCSLSAAVGWIQNNKNQLEVLKVVKEVVKFALNFFCPGRASLKLAKVLAGLAIDILDQMDKNAFFGALARGSLPNLQGSDVSQKYQSGAVTAAKAASVVASVVFAYLAAAKRITGMSIPAAKAEWLSRTGIQLMQFKGGLMFTSGLVKSMNVESGQ